MMESSGALSDYHLLFGDRVAVKRISEGVFEVEAPELPSVYRHFELIANAPGLAYTRLLHELGGEWECELMIERIHVPADRIDTLMARAGGFDLRTQQEIFSGEADWEST